MCLYKCKKWSCLKKVYLKIVLKKSFLKIKSIFCEFRVLDNEKLNVDWAFCGNFTQQFFLIFQKNFFLKVARKEVPVFATILFSISKLAKNVIGVKFCTFPTL
jgi:hypothetical protein